MALPIEDYAVLGDTGTAALVGKDGSVDWLCLPRFDSPACFAALLGGPEHGRWLLGPKDAGASVSRRYVGDSAVLETTWTTDTGCAVVLDVMPIGDGRHADEFTLKAGEELTFSTTWVPSHHELPLPLEYQSRIDETIELSETWAGQCSYDGPYRPHVVRSLLTLRLLTHGGTGGIVAAPTTSLPEDFGGQRNWDYRFCWLRDASLTLEALLESGYEDEARLWRSWLLRAAAGDPQDLQIMYAVAGGRDLAERTLEHLPGYAGSAPVRIGNGAVTQRQTDVLGEVMIALQMAREVGLDDNEDSWSLQRSLVEELARHWDQPDNGLWEIRGPLRRFTHSRVMVWVAFDRAIAAVEQHGLAGPVDRWRDLRDKVREEILEHGYDADRNTFTQHYETSEVDASLLVL